MKVGRTNKTFSKRIKVTKKGKILARKGGQNHFNAKESRRKQVSNKKGLMDKQFSNRVKRLYGIKTQ